MRTHVILVKVSLNSYVKRNRFSKWLRIDIKRKEGFPRWDRRLGPVETPGRLWTFKGTVVGKSIKGTAMRVTWESFVEAELSTCILFQDLWKSYLVEIYFINRGLLWSFEGIFLVQEAILKWYLLNIDFQTKEVDYAWYLTCTSL